MSTRGAALLAALLLPAPSGLASEGSPPRALTVTAVGDTMIDASAGPFVHEFGYWYPFEAVAPLLREAGLAIANLEGPLTRRGTPEVEKQFTFRVPPDSAFAMRRAGIDAVALANNHTLDQGRVGLEETAAALREAGIAFAGAGATEREARAPARLVREGVRIAILSYSNTFPEEFWAKDERPGTAYGDPRAIEADVRAARKGADLVIASFHWGQELAATPRPYQLDLGRLAVDAGADLVLGTHPHTLQGVERYKGALIFYSLGNFAFGSYSQRVRDGILARMTFRGRVVRDGGAVEPVWDPVLLVPLDVFNPEVYFRPRPVGGDRAGAILADLARMSAPFGTRIEPVPPPADLSAPGPVGVVR